MKKKLNKRRYTIKNDEFPKQSSIYANESKL